MTTFSVISILFLFLRSSYRCKETFYESATAAKKPGLRVNKRKPYKRRFADLKNKKRSTPCNFSPLKTGEYMSKQCTKVHICDDASEEIISPSQPQIGVILAESSI
jgi:hypothetical protein